MDFKIDNKTLKMKNFSKNTFEVKSQPVKYSGCLTESDPLEYVTKTYKKGDVIFWRGHVAVCINSDKLIHAYGPKRKVLIMPIEETILRIERTANLQVKKIFKS